MAIHRLLSLVCLLAPLAVAQEYSEGDLLDATITKSVTETVTKYLSQCGVTIDPFQPPDTTLSGTTTFTSTLRSTISIIVTANATNASGVSPASFNVSQSGVAFTSLSLPHTPSACSGFNCSTPFANVTKVPCSTATVTVPAPVVTSSVTPHGTSSTGPTNVSPSQVPISGSARPRDDAAIQGLLGTLSIVAMLICNFM
ncbi:hypothetical protein F5Y13DRAFT_107162 [Hypoxylon sp. FL1857]|nr:hypothetical protein F5Y13DRAFT_107162 [Hypoxylon sp. FL1857]